MTTYKNIMETLHDRRQLRHEQTTAIMNMLMSGELGNAETSGLLIAWRAKGESAEELATAAAVLRKFVAETAHWPDNLTDTCGTGGDASKTFNISTAAAIIAAGAGAKIAKHGNRAMSGASGSADVLEAAGVAISLGAKEVIQCIEETGVGFLFAPTYHKAARHVAPARKALGVRTIFNLLGPLANPAAAKNQLLGVFAKKWLKPMTEAAKRLGTRRVLAVCGEDGMDEISICAPTKIVERIGEKEKSYTTRPADFGFKTADIKDIRVENPRQSLAMINRIFANEAGAPRDAATMNAGATLYIAGKADTLKQGAELALEAIQSGAAARALEALRKTTTRLQSK